MWKIQGYDFCNTLQHVLSLNDYMYLCQKNMTHIESKCCVFNNKRMCSKYDLLLRLKLHHQLFILLLSNGF